MSTTAARVQALFDAIPYARFLGLKLELAGDEMTAIMPFAPALIGNPALPAIHGGVLGAMMEMTAIAQVSIARMEDDAEAVHLPRPINVTVEYLRSGRPVDTFARASIRRMGRRIANVHVEAWQEARAAPIAALRAHFLLRGA